MVIQQQAVEDHVAEMSVCGSGRRFQRGRGTRDFGFAARTFTA